MAESKIVDEIIDDIVARGVEEVNGQSCVCGAWTLRISRTPKVPAPAKSEVFVTEESIGSPQ